MANLPTYQRSKDWISRTVLDGHYSILLPLISEKADLNQFYRMNQTAAFLWENLAKPHAPNSLLKKLQTAYDLSNTPISEVKSEIEGCLSEWVRMGAVLIKSKARR